MRKLAIASGLGLLMMVGSASPAFAQDGAKPPVEYPVCTKDPKPEDVDAARTKYTAGKVDYDEGHYASAIERFRDAYARDCTKHDMLIIISRAYEQNQDRPEAIRALEEYLRRVPNTPDRATYEKRLTTLRDALEKEKKEKAAAAAANNGSSSAPPTVIREHTVAPWVVVGIGGAAIVAGIIVLAATPETPKNCNADTGTCTLQPGETQTQLDDDRSQAGRHRDMPIYGGIAIGGGAAIVVAGLLWHFLEPTGPVTASTTPKVTPAVGPGYAGLSFGASF